MIEDRLGDQQSLIGGDVGSRRTNLREDRALRHSPQFRLPKKLRKRKWKIAAIKKFIGKNVFGKQDSDEEDDENIQIDNNQAINQEMKQSQQNKDKHHHHKDHWKDKKRSSKIEIQQQQQQQQQQ